MRTSGVLLFIAYLGFISLGLPDAAHGINWPFVRTEFGVPTGWLGLVIAAGGVGYLMSSFSVGYLMSRFGVGWLLVISSLLVSCGLFGFYFSSSFIIFVLFSIVIGMGSGAIDAGLNAYAAEHFSTRHMNWLHAAFGVGATAGPIIVTTVLVSFSQNWRLGYAVLASILFVMAMVFVFSRHLWESDKHAPKKADVQVDETPAITQLQALKHPVIRFQIAFFFLYAGVALGALSFTMSVTPYTSYFGLALMGFCAAPIFPCMISQTAMRVGKRYSVHAIGFQMSAAVCGAMSLPFLSGLIGGLFGLSLLTISFLFYALLLFGLFHVILRRASWSVSTIPT